jgi:dihydroxy-acid dehydratase
MDGFLRRTSLKAQGLSPRDYERPIIGICNNTSDFNRCHTHFDGMVEAIKEGVQRAGGLPRVFNSMTMGADNTLPLGVSFMHRNLLAMEIEQIATVYPMDGLVLLGACDETIPAVLMAAASIDLPAIVLPGGPSYCGYWRGRRVGSGWDCHRAFEAFGRDELGESDLESLEDVLESNPGHCNTMGTAATMTTIAEAIGMAPAGSSAIPAVDARRLAMARDVGTYAMELVAADLRPSQIMTESAFDNAIRVLATIEGSANAVVHLLALARRLGIALPLERFDELSTSTPVLLNLKPSGEYFLEDLFRAGGVPALLHAMGDLIHGEIQTVTGRTLAEEIEEAETADAAVIGTLANPVAEPRGVAVLRGNIAPDGAIMRLGVTSDELLTHTGRAVVFDGHEELEERLYAPDFDIRPGDVIVLRGEGPRGSVGMPEYGHIELPPKLLQQGVTDLLRITDSRIGGTVKGTVVQYVSPEAAVGGPLSLVRTGDVIHLDVATRRLSVDVPQHTLDRRRDEPRHEEPLPARGFARLYAECVTQADQGCDFEFLSASTQSTIETEAQR